MRRCKDNCFSKRCRYNVLNSVLCLRFLLEGSIELGISAMIATLSVSDYPSLLYIEPVVVIVGLKRDFCKFLGSFFILIRRHEPDMPGFVSYTIHKTSIQICKQLEIPESSNHC